jgi:protein arginine N-methyltransferase 1
MTMPDKKTTQISDALIRVRAGDQEFVVSALCTHRQGRLVYGYVNDRTQRITCPLHHSIFDLVSGCLLSGPAECELRVEATGGERDG